jgi:hypothetical protein
MKKAAVFVAGALVAAGLAYAALLRPWHLCWGASEEETSEALPGDELTPNVKGQATHAVTIHAPADEVWKWIIQIGQDKGGFYSYAWLENLVGCHMVNAEHIVPEYQHLQVGDQVWLHPKAPPLPVVHVERERDLVLGSNTNEPGTWSFHLRPCGENAVRLIARSRGDWTPSFLRALYQYGLFEPAHFIMERKMLLTIKRLAERRKEKSHVQ